jgi:hypothetical protein
MPKNVLSSILLFSLAIIITLPEIVYAQDSSVADQSDSEYEQRLRGMMGAAHKVATEKLGKLYDTTNSTKSPDERNIKGFVLSTDVRTFREIPEHVDREIAKIQESIRFIIFQVATDAEEYQGDTGTLVYNSLHGIGYKNLPKDAIKKYKRLMEGKKKNNVSVRSVQIAIQLLASINKEIMADAERETNIERKRRLYITQAAYVYEMADIVLDVLNNVSLEGKPVLEQIKNDSERRLRSRLSEIEIELERIDRAKATRAITEKYAASLQKSYTLMKKANETTLQAWDDLMKQVSKQENWLKNIKKQSISIELKRNAAKHQLGTLRDLYVLSDLVSLVGDLEELVASIQEIELLELDEETVITLIGGRARGSEKF